ncbi:transmembrane protein 79 [Antennarius striatus]|uniref:transmembrane protein 79 n=1 Tax=Antennarius striatus TaxID=241820 RepID=UPI0035B0AA07
MDDSGGDQARRANGDEMVKSVAMETSTLPWPRDRQTGGQTGGQTGRDDRLSVRSDTSAREAVSWTESERELRSEGEQRGGGAEEEVGLMTRLEEEDEDMPGENRLPDKAAQVFRPAVTILCSPSSPQHSEAFWEVQSEKSPFLGPRGAPQDYNHQGFQYDWREDAHPSCVQNCLSRDALKWGVSLVTSAIFFPFLVWGGFVFLPFDAPLLDSAPLRVVYTLRCSVFAAVPIVLGWLVLGVSRLRFGAFRPLVEDAMKEAGLQEVAVHQRFVSDTVSLFLIYFLQLVVMAIYLSQEQLKLVPLLTIVFAVGRLVYWVAAAFGSSIRAFGFGLSFLPSLVMMVANVFFIFTMDSSGSIFSLPLPPEEAPPPPPGKQRFWG